MTEQELGDFKLFGRNVRSYRKSFSWTMQELADKCGICRATLARIEAGMVCTKRTQAKIAHTFNIKADALWVPELSSVRQWFLFSGDEARWTFGDQKDAMRWQLNEEKARLDPNSIQNLSERLRLGRNGLATAFTQLHRGHLPDGFHGFITIEVFTQVKLEVPINVSSFCIYCVRGTLKLILPNQNLIFRQGDIFTFDTSLGVAAEPLEPLGPNDLPPIIVGVTLQVRSSSKRPAKG